MLVQERGGQDPAALCLAWWWHSLQRVEENQGDSRTAKELRSPVHLVRCQHRAAELEAAHGNLAPPSVGWSHLPRQSHAHFPCCLGPAEVIMGSTGGDVNTGSAGQEGELGVFIPLTTARVRPPCPTASPCPCPSGSQARRALRLCIALLMSLSFPTTL